MMNNNNENNPNENIAPRRATSTLQQANQPQRTDAGIFKDIDGLMPKTVNELKEIQARGRKMLIKTKYIKRGSKPYSGPQEKTEEEKLAEKIQKEKDIKDAQPHIAYSSHYYDDDYEYRHVMLPKNLVRWLPSGLLKPQQWVEFGVRQSSSWEHYMVHAPEPHILLFRRAKGYREKQRQLVSNRPVVKEEAKVENPINNETEDDTITTNISDIPPSSRTNLYRTRSLFKK